MTSKSFSTIYVIVVLAALVKFIGCDGFEEEVYCKIDEYKMNYRQCSKCHYQCISCRGPTSNDCLQCRHTKYKGECIYDCPNNFFEDGNGSCQTCNILYCKQCNSISQCTECEENYKLSDNKQSCVYQFEDEYTFIDPDDRNTIIEGTECPDNYATNESGRYCQAIPLCIQENFVNELQENCFDSSNDTMGIKMTLMEESVIYYNEKQANVYSLKDYSQIDSINIHENLIKIVFLKHKIFVMYTHSIDIFSQSPIASLKTVTQPTNIENKKKTYLFSLGSFEQLLLATTSQNDQCKYNFNLISTYQHLFEHQIKLKGIIQNLENENILAEVYVGEQILDITLENNLMMLIISTFQTISIIQLDQDGKKLIFTTKQELSITWNQNFIIDNIFSLIYYVTPTNPYIMLFDGQYLTVFDLYDFKIQQGPLEYPYQSATVVQQHGFIAFYYVNKIKIADLSLVVQGGATKIYEIYIEGKNFLLVFSDPYLYITSKDISISYIDVYDTQFQFIQKIPLRQGKVVSMHVRQPISGEDKETIIVQQYDNVIDIQGLTIKRYLIENCYNTSVKFFGQRITFINGKVTDEIRGIDFYVSINIYNTLVFILQKDGKVIKYKEITNKNLENIQQNQLLTMYINEIDRKIKLFGLITGHQKLVIVFSYFSLSIDFIQTYNDILYMSENIFIAQTAESDNVLYIKNTFDKALQVILQNENSLGSYLLNYKYQVFLNLIQTNNSQGTQYTYSLIVIDQTTYSFCEINNLADEFQFMDFISESEILYISQTEFLSINVVSCAITNSQPHGITNKLRDIQILLSQNLLIFDEYSQQTNPVDQQMIYSHTYRIYSLVTFKLKQSIIPYKKVNNILVDINELSVQAFFFNSNYQKPDIRDLFVLTSYNLNEIVNQEKNVSSFDLCSSSTTEYLLNNDIFQLKTTYAPLQFCKTLDRAATFYYNQQKSVQLFTQSILGKVQEYFSIGCSFNCMEMSEVQNFNDQIMYQEKILPNFALILQQNTLYFPQDYKIMKSLLFPKFNIIMVQLYNLVNGITQISIKLIKYPSKQEIFSYTFNQICNQLIANIVEVYNTLIICDTDLIQVYDINDLTNSIYNTFNIQQVCTSITTQINFDVGNSSRYIINCVLGFSQFDPLIYINGKGIYNYQDNTFKPYPHLIFDMKLQSNDRQQINNFLSLFEPQVINYREQVNVLISIMFQNILFYDRTNNYAQFKTPIKLNSKNYYFEDEYFVTLNEYNNYETLYIYNYNFEPMIFFEEDISKEFKEPYYFNCQGQSRLFILYTNFLAGYLYPFNENDEPFLEYILDKNDKDFSIQLCTDQHLILLINPQQSNSNQYQIKVVYYNTKSIQKTYPIRQDQLIIKQYKQGNQQNFYYKFKGIALIQNVIISLLDKDSDLVYLLSTGNFIYDETNDYGVIIDNQSNNYIQIIDFSLIFPFNMNSYSFANDIMIGPYQFGYTNTTTDEYQDKWTIFYNSNKNAIYFYDLDEEIETKLVLDETILESNHRILYKIEKLQQPVNIDPEQEPDYPNPSLISKILFSCIFNDFVVIFSKEKILQYLPVNNFEKNIMEARLNQDEASKNITFSKLKMDNITHVYSVVEIDLPMPAELVIGKIVFTCFFILQGFPNLAIIDANNNFILESDVYLTLPIEYSYDEINLFNVIVNKNTDKFLIMIGTPQRIRIYTEYLNLALELDNKHGGIQDALLEEQNQYLMLLTSDQLLVYKYFFETGGEKIDKISPFISFNLLSRNQNKLSLINNNHFAILSKSLLTMYLMNNSTIANIYSIKNQYFNHIQNAVLFDESRFLLIWDVHRVYLYDVSLENKEVTQIFYREYTHIKILYTGQYWENHRLFIRFIGVTSTNVFDVRKEIKNIDPNAVQQIHYLEGNNQNTESNDISSKCIQVSNLYKNAKDQARQIDFLISQSYQQIYRIIYYILHQNQTIYIPEKSFVLSANSKLSLIFDLNDNNVLILQHEQSSSAHSQIFKSIKFKNGVIDVQYVDDSHQISDQQTSKKIQFEKLDAVSFSNIKFMSSIQLQDCYKVNLREAMFLQTVESVLIRGTSSQAIDKQSLNFTNILVLVNQIDRILFTIDSFNEVSINGMTVQKNQNKIYSTLDVQHNKDDEEFPFKDIPLDLKNNQDPYLGFINLKSISTLNFFNFEVSDLWCQKNIISAIFLSNIKMYNFTIENMNLQPPIASSQYDEVRYAIIDIQLALKKVDIRNLIVDNSQFDKIIKINSTYQDWSQIDKIQFSKRLSVSMNNVTIQNILPKYLTANSNYFKNILQLQATNVSLSNFKVKRIVNMTSCFFFSNIESMMTRNMNFSKIDRMNNIISITQLKQLTISDLKIFNFTSIINCILLEDAQIILDRVMIINPHKGFKYINESTIKVKFSDKSSSLLLKDCVFQGIKNQRGNGTVLNIVNANSVKLQKVTISDNFCILNGGAIYAINSFLQLYNTTIENNYSALSGGGLYLVMSNIELDKKFSDHLTKQSLIQNNGAQIGGGIRYIAIKKPMLIVNNPYIIKNNSARFYGHDYAMYPHKLKVLNEKIYTSVSSSLSSIKEKVLFIQNDDFIVELYFIIIKIQYFWVDEQGQSLKYYSDDDPILQLYKEEGLEQNFKDMIEEIEQYQMITLMSEQIIFNSISRQTQLFGKVKQLNDTNFQFIEIESSFLLSPENKSIFFLLADLKYIPLSLKSNITTSSNNISVQFRSCKEGEIIKQYEEFEENKYYECLLCQNNTFSIQKPSNEIKCQVCPDNAQFCEGNQITADQGFWREPKTAVIEECINQPLKCTRKDQKELSCSEGGFGPRCESCDYKNQVFKNYIYGKSGRFNCARFEKSSEIGRQIAITIIFLLAFGLYQGFSVIKINKQMANQLKMYYLKKSGLVNFQVTLSKSGFSSLVKFFVGYCQMLQILLQFKLKIPDGMLNTITFVGNPLEISMYSLDFVFIKLGLHESLDIVYIRLLWLYINSCIYFSLSVLLTSLYTCFKKRKYKFTRIYKIINQIISTAAIYVYYSIYLNLVEIIVNIVSCQKIGTQYYILADSQFQCSSNNHQLYAYRISLPILFIIAIIFPLFIFYKLYKNRNNLYRVSFYLKFGFFFQEFQQKKYFWEIIRMTNRTLMYMVSTYYSQKQLIKSVILSFITFVYLALTYKNQPYKTKIQNRLDFLVAFTMIICFQLGVINCYTTDKVLQGLSVLMIIILNVGIILFFVFSILKERILIQKSQYLYPFLQILIKYMPFIFGRIFKEQKSCFIFHNGWKKVQHIVFENKLPLLRLKLNLISLPSQKIDFSPQSEGQIFSAYGGQFTTKNLLPSQQDLLRIQSNFSNHEGIVINTLQSKQNQHTPNKHFNFFSDSFVDTNRKAPTPPVKENIINDSTDNNNIIFSSRINMNPVKQSSPPKTIQNKK